MSSFIGHSLAGLTVYLTTTEFQINDRVRSSSKYNLPWLMWLVAIASIPDIDYLIPSLILKYNNHRVRTTHSFIGALIVPACTILILYLLGKRGKTLELMSLQAVLAGLSHLLLDLLTGVLPLPLLYPSLEVFRLPFGLLPSAGKIQLNNYLFYRNLSIELGVIVPLVISLLLIIRDRTLFGKHRLLIAVGLLVSACFMMWAFSLSR
ncbi:metal-dependent hydrolase [Chamaesiphon sp. VAR_69_metabat_338]|uniref:metal-dependent hydrolase n=1 Tax=Chamaesiphon sp. VAR_69_metabat_338 TaxID=2964704 RepID=UPI00286E0BA3|nr:metal-dependent hydrolase [Chamaesiphon sp. VAR_69_metabat_338]